MNWLSEHGEALVVAISGIVALLLTTEWGRARGAALRSIVRVVEGLGVTGAPVGPALLKMTIAEEIGGEKLSVQRALEAEVDRVDQKKRPESRAKKFGKFIGRALLGLVLRRIR